MSLKGLRLNPALFLSGTLQRRSQFDRPGMSANANVVHIGIRGSRRWVGGVHTYSHGVRTAVAIAVADAFFTVGPTGGRVGGAGLNLTLRDLARFGQPKLAVRACGSSFTYVSTRLMATESIAC